MRTARLVLMILASAVSLLADCLPYAYANQAVSVLFALFFKVMTLGLFCCSKCPKSLNGHAIDLCTDLTVKSP